MRRILLTLALLLVLSAPALAQGDSPPPNTCDRESESLQDCYRRLFAAATEVRRQAQAAKADGQISEVKEAAAASTDAADKRVTPASTPAASGSLIDLLPRFLVAGGVLGLEQTDQAITFAKTFEPSESLRIELRGDAFQDAELFEPLREGLPEGLDESILSGLQDEIGDFDKTDLQVKLSWEKGEGFHRFGRDPDDYEDLSFGWFQGLHSDLHGEDRSIPFEEWLLSDTVLDLDADVGDDSILQMTPNQLQARLDLSDEERDDIVAGVVAAATGMEDLRFATETSMAELAKQVSEMVTNQPQLILDGVYRDRDDLTGPTEWSAGLRFEMGLSGNVNDFLQWSKRPENPCDARSYSCLQAWRAGSSALQLSEEAAIDRGNRLTIELSYTDTDPLSFDLTGQGIPTSDFSFSLDRTQKWTGALAYGINLNGVRLPNLVGLLGQLNTEAAADIEPDPARFDLEAAYDDVTGDPMRQSRLTATATLSQKMAEKTIFSVSLVWAEKPEYRGEVDEELSANLGLRWSFYGGDDDDSNGNGDDGNGDS